MRVDAWMMPDAEGHEVGTSDEALVAASEPDDFTALVQLA
jgi:hypothetical protein